MMRIRMEKTAAGPAGTFVAGREYTVPTDVAAPLIEAGAAIPLRMPRETATAPPIERALLIDVDGVGPERVEALKALGIVSVDDLAGANEKALTAIDGVGPTTARRLIGAARAMLED